MCEASFSAEKENVIRQEKCAYLRGGDLGDLHPGDQTEGQVLQREVEERRAIHL